MRRDVTNTEVRVPHAVSAYCHCRFLRDDDDDRRRDHDVPVRRVDGRTGRFSAAELVWLKRDAASRVRSLSPCCA